MRPFFATSSVFIQWDKKCFPYNVDNCHGYNQTQLDSQRSFVTTVIKKINFIAIYFT